MILEKFTDPNLILLVTCLILIAVIAVILIALYDWSRKNGGKGGE